MINIINFIKDILVQPKFESNPPDNKTIDPPEKPIQGTKCPNCHKTLIKIPKRKTVCPFCSKPIYVRTTVEGIRKLVTTTQAEYIEKEWNEKYKEDWMTESLLQFDISVDKYQAACNEYLQKNKFLSKSDVYWRLLSEVNHKLIKAGDFQQLSLLYTEQAYFLHTHENKKCNHILRANHDLTLRSLQMNKLIEQVQIHVVDNSCEECKVNQKKIMSFSEALEKKLLPHLKCKNDYNLKSEEGWCRCTYFPVV